MLREGTFLSTAENSVQCTHYPCREIRPPFALHFPSLIFKRKKDFHMLPASCRSNPNVSRIRQASSEHCIIASFFFPEWMASATSCFPVESSTGNLQGFTGRDSSVVSPDSREDSCHDALSPQMALQSLREFHAVLPGLDVKSFPSTFIHFTQLPVILN